MYRYDNIRLDDPAGRWALNGNSQLRILPARRDTGVSVPGRDGVIPGRDPNFEPGLISLGLTVYGNGATAVERQADALRNLEFLYGLFSLRRKTSTLMHEYGDGDVRYAEVRVLQAAAPTSPTLEFYQMNVVFEVMSVFWRTSAAYDHVFSGTGTVLTGQVLTLDGGNAPVVDAQFRIPGPFTTCSVRTQLSTQNTTTDRRVDLGACLSGHALVIDSEAWTVRDVTGTSWLGGTLQTFSANTGRGPLLPLDPYVDSSTGRFAYSVRASFTGAGASLSMTVRAKRAYL